MLDWTMLKHSLFVPVYSLIYDFCMLWAIWGYTIWGRAKINYWPNENYHMWKIKYPYPVPFSKNHYSKNNKAYMINAFRIMITTKKDRPWATVYIKVASDKNKYWAKVGNINYTCLPCLFIPINLLGSYLIVCMMVKEFIKNLVSQQTYG